MGEDMAEPVLLQTRIEAVLVLTMNRGDKLNALDLALMSAAKSLIHDLADLSLRDGLEYIQTTDAGKQ